MTPINIPAIRIHHINKIQLPQNSLHLSKKIPISSQHLAHSSILFGA